MPAARQACASRLQFSTTFCSFACSGAPVSANAPPSIITSFCMSWMISAARLRSMLRVSFTASPPLAHERLAAAAHLGLHAVHGCAGRNEEPVPVRAAPVDVADVLAARSEHPHALRARHPDVAALVALHPVDELPRRQVAGADAFGEEATV